ncbi:MAG: TonB-dependent receptor plug domain-containing protein [Fibrobacterota bacterium]
MYKVTTTALLCLVFSGFSEVSGAAKDSLQELGKIVVTGTKTERKMELAPVKTEIITSDDIRRMAASDLYQVLENAQGIRMEQQCNNCSFTIMRMSGLEGGYAKILIDGMPVYSGLAGVYGMQQIQAGLIDRIEIVKGAGSALYGSDAIAGVVNVITKKPDAGKKFSVGASAGVNPIDGKNKYGGMPTNSNVNFSASATEGDFAAVIAGQSNTSDEIDNNGDMATDKINSKNLGGTAKLYWYDVLGEKSLLGVTGRVIYENRKGGSIEKDPEGNYPIDNALSPAGPGTEHILTERYEGGLNIEKELAESTSIIGILNYVSHFRNATNAAAWEKMQGLDLDYNPVGENDFSRLAEISPQPFLTEENTIVGETNVSQKIGNENTLLAGFQFKRTEVNENINGEGWFERNFQDIGVYAQDEWNISRKADLAGGVRYDIHNSEDKHTGTEYEETSVNPRISFRYEPLEDLVTRASWGTGFRVPGDFSEDAHLCASAPLIKKNNALEPEKAVSYNVSAEWARRGIKAELGIFRTNITDKLVLSEYSGNDGAYDLEWVNAESDAYTQGAEITGGYMSGFYEIEAGAVYTNAQFEKEQTEGVKESKYIMRSPAVSGHVDIGLFSEPVGSGFKDGWRLDLDFRLTGSMYIERDGEVMAEYPSEKLKEIVKTEPYLIVDARVGKKIEQISTDLYIAAENLTNHVQERKQWDIDDAAMIYAPLTGVMVSAGFSKDF